MMIAYFANTKSVFAEFLRVHGMSKIEFCFRIVYADKRKSTYKIFVSACFLWTSLGLNQGPPDYESVALTN